MCLKVKGKAKAKKSKKDITCYKVLRDHRCQVYSTPFHMMLIRLGQEYKTGAEKMDCSYSQKRDETIITGNAFHSFKTEKEARAYAEVCNKADQAESFAYVVAECVIPAENNIIMGLFKEYEGICSDTIKYVKIV